jgi:hypothetical protein
MNDELSEVEEDFHLILKLSFEARSSQPVRLRFLSLS